MIGILGRSRVGKDTVANLIREMSPVPFQNMHIAKSLKDSLQSMYDLSNDQLWGISKDIPDMRYGGMTPRELCSAWQKKLFNMHGHDFLIKRMLIQYDNSHKPHPNIIIPDVRHPHDCYEIKKRNGIIVKIVRTPNTIILSSEDHIDKMHGDITLHNKSSIENLRVQIQRKVLHLIKT